MHGDTPRVSEAAGQFRVSYDKKTGKHFVCWYDKNHSGVLVEHRLPHGFTKEATAKSAMHKLRRKAEKQRPRVELCPNRNLYMRQKSTAVARYARPTRNSATARNSYGQARHRRRTRRGDDPRNV